MKYSDLAQLWDRQVRFQMPNHLAHLYSESYGRGDMRRLANYDIQIRGAFDEARRIEADGRNGRSV